MAGLFQVLWGQPKGRFKKAAVLKGSDNEPLIIPADEKNIIENICTRPSAVDWDGDGDLDLVVGNFAGGFYLFTGAGGGKFDPTPQALVTGEKGEPLKIRGVHSDPFPIDWDGDGDLDLLSGSSDGGVQWSENAAGPGGPPDLQPFRSLVEPGRIEYGQPLTEAELKGPTSNTRIWVADANADGKLDLFVGDSVTLVEPAAGLTQAELKEKQAEWQAALTTLSEELQAAQDDNAKFEELNQKLQEHYEARAKFAKEDRTGFVWLYRQK